jgi:hypothetical protein
LLDQSFSASVSSRSAFSEALRRVRDHHGTEIPYEVRHEQAAKRHSHKRSEQKQALKTLSRDDPRKPFHDWFEKSQTHALLVGQGCVQSALKAGNAHSRPSLTDCTLSVHPVYGFGCGPGGAPAGAWQLHG